MKNADGRTLELCLLGGFSLSHDIGWIDVPLGGQHVVAYLALRDQPTRRAQLAGALWGDRTDDRAFANLRSSLWRLRQATPDLVRDRGECLELGTGVTVDHRERLAWADRILHGPRRDADLEIDVNAAGLASELLPAWSQDWVLIERERLRQRMLHALEALVELLVAAGDCSRAIDVGLCAIRLEPFRESTHRAVIAAHLAEGNHGEAHRQFQRFRELLADELGLEPSDRMAELLAARRSA
jgi:DNA-binding SARP family transcriptional activator